jgi:hypothetical protein
MPKWLLDSTGEPRQIKYTAYAVQHKSKAESITGFHGHTVHIGAHIGQTTNQHTFSE